MAIRLVIARHTQTHDNAKKIMSGQRNATLNEIGIAQADALAIRIGALPDIVAILSSDLIRTRYLASRIGEISSVPPRYMAELRELDSGLLTGRVTSEARKSFPDAKFLFDHNPFFDLRDLSGEGYQDLLNRFAVVAETISNVALQHKDREVRIVVVSHGTFLTRIFVHEYHCIEKLHPQGDFQEFAWPTP